MKFKVEWTETRECETELEAKTMSEALDRFNTYDYAQSNVKIIKENYSEFECKELKDEYN